MSVTLVRLETFSRVARLQNYTRVAEELHLTQPGVGQQVRALEKHFGVRLVGIVRRRPVLTDAGWFLAACAGDLLGTMARTLRLVTVRGRTLSPAARAFRALLLDAAGNLRLASAATTQSVRWLVRDGQTLTTLPLPYDIQRQALFPLGLGQ